MSAFINLEDYDASIHTEILDAVTRNDLSVVEICEDRAVEQMKGYLQGRYDCDAIFSATGTSRNQLVLMMAVDIALYHIFCAHNPQKMSQLRQDRYDRALEWLRKVSENKLSIAGAPMLESGSQIPAGLMSSNPKRDQYL